MRIGEGVKRDKADVTVRMREETDVLKSNSSFDDESCWTEIAGGQGGGITRT